MSFKDGINRLWNRVLRMGKSAPAGAGLGSRSSSDPARQEQLRRDASGHDGILSEEFAKTLDSADRGLSFPESPQDPLAYLGNVDPLGLTEPEKDVVRQWTLELLEERGEKAVWNSRLRLKLELRYLISEGGLQKMRGGKNAGRRR